MMAAPASLNYHDILVLHSSPHLYNIPVISEVLLINTSCNTRLSRLGVDLFYSSRQLIMIFYLHIKWSCAYIYCETFVSNRVAVVNMVK